MPTAPLFLNCRGFRGSPKEKISLEELRESPESEKGKKGEKRQFQKGLSSHWLIPDKGGHGRTPKLGICTPRLREKDKDLGIRDAAAIGFLPKQPQKSQI